MLKHHDFGRSHAGSRLSSSRDKQSNTEFSWPPRPRPIDIDRLRELASSVGHSVEAYLVVRNSAETVRHYKRDVRIYEDWCEANICEPVPADHALLVRFFLFLTQYNQGPALLNMISAIQYLHAQRGYLINVRPIRSLVNSYVNSKSPPVRQSAALDIVMLRKIVEALPTSLEGTRDRALLILGFAAALRPSELAGLDIGQRAPDGTGSIIIDPKAIRIVLHTSKSDHQRRGVEKLIVQGCAPCPISAVQAWLCAADIAHGAVFRRIYKPGRVLARRIDPRSISGIVRRGARALVSKCGNSEAASFDFARLMTGYSLRAGFVTSAICANVDAEVIAHHLGWANSSLAIRYTRRAIGADKALVGLVLGRTEHEFPGAGQIVD